MQKNLFILNIFQDTMMSQSQLTMTSISPSYIINMGTIGKSERVSSNSVEKNYAILKGFQSQKSIFTNQSDGYNP